MYVEIIWTTYVEKRERAKLSSFSSFKSHQRTYKAWKATAETKLRFLKAKILTTFDDVI
jgi:hypothetical protein